MNAALTEHLHPRLTGSHLTALAELVGLGRRVEIVDVGSSPLVGEPACYAPLQEAGLARVTGFEPDPTALAALATRCGDSERHLGHAVGDGTDGTLHVCDEPGFSSLLTPDEERLALLTDFPRLARVTETRQVGTVRLDDVAEIGTVDLLALDVQGAELAVIEGASRILGDAVAVQTEVGFHRIYRDAPTFADVDLALRGAGFEPHTFVTTRTWPLAPVRWDDPLQDRARHLVEADLLYVRDLTRLADPGRTGLDTLRALTLIACGAYGSVGLGLVALGELTRRGAVPADAEERYRELCTSVGRPQAEVR